MHKDDTLALLRELINIRSVTPEDCGVQDVLKKALSDLGFAITDLPHPPVSNFWAELGDSGPLLVFAGHTDVVHEGELSQWATEPYQATVKNGVLYGRGACDMKSSIAAFIAAVSELKAKNKLNGRIGFLITSGEEGDQFDLGTPKVMEYLEAQGKKIDYCIVGEPSSQKTLGDTVKIGRRGSLTGEVTVTGKQGHVAYPHLATNPIHHIGDAINALSNHSFDEGNDFFPKTTLQISNIHSGTGAGNVIPGELTFKFNCRYSTESTDESLKTAIEALLKQHLSLPHQINWRLNGNPFLSEQGRLTEVVSEVIQENLGVNTDLSTTGGTSDGRFIAPFCDEVIELGPTNASIHQVNEFISLAELESLQALYRAIIEKILT